MSIDSIHQLIEWKPPHRKAIIDEGILLPGTRLMIFGAAKAWKSMLSLHTGFMLSTGQPWFGFKTIKVTAFKYQIELPKAVDRDRVEKYAKGCGLYPDYIFFKTPTDRVKLDTAWGANYLAKDIEEVRKRSPDQHLILIIDPLYKFMAGHISDEYDVKKFQDNMDELLVKYNLSLIIIHHSRLTKTDASGAIVDLGPEEAMGSSYWNNWVDTMIRAKLLNPYAGANKVEVTFELVRNAQKVLPNFQIYWDRSNLQPTVIKVIKTEVEEPTVRGLKDES